MLLVQHQLEHLEAQAGGRIYDQGCTLGVSRIAPGWPSSTYLALDSASSEHTDWLGYGSTILYPTHPYIMTQR